MIRTVIKRDGSKEDFIPQKLNAWGEWATKTLGDYVDWSSIVLDAVSTCPEECKSTLLQERLIKSCLDRNSWSYNRMAGRLYAALINKNMYNGKHPTVKELHTKLIGLGHMVDLGYTDDEYTQVEKMINHKKDFRASHSELSYTLSKYGLQNRSTGEKFETQQFIYMRMAMALAVGSKPENKMKDVEAWYRNFSEKRINAPTPNFVNLGTKLKGFASCCLYTADDNAKSLAIGDHIAYTMTYMSAGIGSHLQTRSINDPVRGGSILHQGKLPYYRSMVGAVKANLQAGRGGACTTFYNMFDPEVEDIAMLKNPMSTEDKKIRGMDYSAGSNKFFARKAAKKEKVFLFNKFTAPDLYKALYSDDMGTFESLYNKYEKDESFKKTYIDARELTKKVLNEGFETGRAYLHWIDEMNSHTPFIDEIYSSNLCSEVCLPTKPYQSMQDLYSTEFHHRGEVALCSLAGINVDNIKTDDEYEEATYYALLMIDRCIHMSEFELPHLGLTAKARLNAGVGIIGLAHYLAKNHAGYSTQKGKDLIHQVAERHAYFLTKASLKLGKELGNAPWIDKTKWPKGWLFIDTYNKNVDGVVNTDLQYDWETLRSEIIENGGIRNSVLVAHMPSESSSKASGTTNGVYPIRDLSLLKGDGNNITYWCAPEGDKLGKWYELAWDVPTKDMIDVYAIIQKWTDQGISADLYRKIIGDEKVGSAEMLGDYFYMTKMGLKTRYYVNSKTSDGVDFSGDDEQGCAGGACTL
jgi:ribonucleoside-diphosphate reductase alpha chain